MPDYHRDEAELRRLIAAKEVFLVVGAGVSLSATKGAPAAGWKGLLLSGVELCGRRSPELAGRWAERRREDSDYDGLIEAVASVPGISWTEPTKVERWVRGREPAVLHLHYEPVTLSVTRF